MLQKYSEVKAIFPHVHHVDLKDLLLNSVGNIEVYIFLKLLYGLGYARLKLLIKTVTVRYILT